MIAMLVQVGAAVSCGLRHTAEAFTDDSDIVMSVGQAAAEVKQTLCTIIAVCAMFHGATHIAHLTGGDSWWRVTRTSCKRSLIGVEGQFH